MTNVMRGTNWGRVLVVWAVALVLGLGAVTPPAAHADSWDSALSSMDALHDGYTAMEAIIKAEKSEITALNQKNNAQLTRMNTSIQAIDKAKVDQLKSTADAAVKKYAPLLAEYTSLGKQATEARKNKDKKTADLLDLKRNKLKPSVDAAKLEIKNKKDALSAARTQATAKKKVVQDALLPVKTLKQQITAENKLISSANKNKSAAEKLYRSAVKQGNAVAAAAELTIMYNELGKVHTSQQKIKTWATQITSTLSAAQAKLPK
jgi:predicted  nucleic acid-binding Zn-ribbon protein